MDKDLISRQQAIKEVKELFSMGDCYCDEYAIVGMLNAMPSVHPEVIRCKDCIYQTESWSGIKYCEAHGDHIGKDYDYCSNARRKQMEYYDLISRQVVINVIKKNACNTQRIMDAINNLPSIQSEQHKIGYSEYANAILMWINNMLTDKEYKHIIDKLNAHWAERRE